jgi:hypothetical protein
MEGVQVLNTPDRNCDTNDNIFLWAYEVQNAGQNHDMKTADRSFENVAQFRYLGTTITNQTLIQEEIKRRLNSGNACYHSVQKLMFCFLEYTKL